LAKIYFLHFQLSIYDNGASFGQSLLDLKMSKSTTHKRVALAGILIGGKYAFSRWKNVARLMSYNEDSFLVRKISRSLSLLQWKYYRS
jgi:hypothetical protein